MAQKIKVSNGKSWKSPDELVAASTVAFDFLLENKQKIIKYVIAVLCVAFVFGGWRFYSYKMNKKAANVYHEALGSYHMEMARANTDKSEKYEQVLDKFIEVTEKYPRTSIASRAFLYSGHIYYQLGEFDKSIESYKNFLEKASSDDPLRILGFDGSGYAYEAKGDYSNALKYYKKLAEERKGPLVETGHLNIGRCYEELGETDKAVETYQQLLALYPGSEYSTLVEERIKALKRE